MVKLYVSLAWIGMVMLLVNGFIGNKLLDLNWAVLFAINGYLIQLGTGDLK
jgi:hypothetical protein